MKKFILSIIVLFSIFSCQKTDSNTGNSNHSLTPFTVTVLKRIPTTGIINWTESMNYYNSDTVKYKVFLNNRLFDSNLVRTKDTLIGLSGDTLYYGKVIAYTKTGDTASAPFVLDKIQEYIAFNSENNFEVFNLSSGVRMWSKSWNIYSYYDGSPTIVGDTIFFSNNQLSIGNTLFANNIKTGQNIWSAIPYGGANTTLVERTNPVYDNGKIFVSAQYGLTSINANTGQVLWTYANSSLYSTPIISNDKIFVSSISQRMLAVDKSNGVLSWQFPVGQTDIRPLLMQNLLLFGTISGNVYCLNQSNGNIIWQRTFPGNNSTESMLAINNIIVIFVNQDGFYGLNPQNGNILWHSDVGWLSYPSITKGNGYIFYSDNSRNKIVAINPTSGNTMWEVNAGYGEYDLIYAKRKIYTSDYNNIYIRDATNGQGVNTIFLQGLIPAIGKTTIRINDSTYYTFNHGNFK